jgi:hypothetical protein
VPVVQHGKEVKGKLILTVSAAFRSPPQPARAPAPSLARGHLPWQCADYHGRARSRAQASKDGVEPFSELELSAGTRLLHKARRAARAAPLPRACSARRAAPQTDKNDGMSWFEEDDIRGRFEKTLVDSGRSYDLKGDLEIPLSVPADAFAPLNSYAGQNLAVVHTIIVRAQTPGSAFRQGGISVTQPLMMQLPEAPAPSEMPPSANAPWLKISDCGGDVKMELPKGGKAQVGGAIDVVVSSAPGVAPLKRMRLLLFRQARPEDQHL